MMLAIKKIVAMLLLGTACMGFCNNSEAASYKLAEAKQLGFGHITMPNNICNDEIIVKSLYFALKDGARKIKNLKVNYNSKLGTLDDCVINAVVDTYELRSWWVEPSADTYDKVVWSQERKWKDDKGKEHTMHIRRYTSEIYDSPGKYSFLAHVRATISLEDAKTGEILVQHYGDKTDDKEIDAFAAIIKEFYKKVNKEIKESQKLTKG